MVPFISDVLMAPLHERRHRIEGAELRPVAESVGKRLGRLVASRSGFKEACTLFRVLFRLDKGCPGRPGYPDEGWATMEVYMRERRGRHQD